MKRKALHLSEEDLNIIIDALHNQWWIRYDPDVEVTVVPHHKLFQRLLDASKSRNLNSSPHHVWHPHHVNVFARLVRNYHVTAVQSKHQYNENPMN